MQSPIQEFLPKPLPYPIKLSDEIYTKLIKTSRKLSELKGVARSIPNQNILINTLILQEAKDSSEIENIITTHDELFLSHFDNQHISQATKEVRDYARALQRGFELIRQDCLLKNSHILQIQGILEQNQAGFRKQAGTKLKNQKGEIAYIPPQNPQDIIRLMDNLEQYINDDSLQELDPLIKMTLIHYQFESIHPFYDGNGRTGRILNVLYLVYKDLLDLPILYLSSFIIRHKAKYYELLRNIQQNEDFQEWIAYLLEGVLQTSQKTIATIEAIKTLMDQTTLILQEKESNIYSKDLVESLFLHPYIKSESLVKNLEITRQTASKYLKICEKHQILHCKKLGRIHFYINTKLFEILQKSF